MVEKLRVDIKAKIITCQSNRLSTALLLEADHGATHQTDGRVLWHLFAVKALPLVVELQRDNISISSSSQMEHLIDEGSHNLLVL